MIAYTTDVETKNIVSKPQQIGVDGLYKSHQHAMRLPSAALMYLLGLLQKIWTKKQFVTSIYVCS